MGIFLISLVPSILHLAPLSPDSSSTCDKPLPQRHFPSTAGVQPERVSEGQADRVADSPLTGLPLSPPGSPSGHEAHVPYIEAHHPAPAGAFCLCVW